MNFLLRTAIIVFLSVFMPHSREYTYTQEIKEKANDVPDVLSPTAADCEVLWEEGRELAHSGSVIPDV